MLLSINELVKRWQISPKSVLHIGAHLAEESNLYQSVGWNKVTWIEANPALIIDIQKKVEPLGQKVIEAALWHTTGEKLSLKVASNGQSSSLLEFNHHGLSPFVDRWHALHAYQDQQVVLHEHGQLLHEGIARGITSNGCLILDTAETRLTIMAGDVSLRSAVRAQSMGGHHAVAD